jgi:hypothetical protein
MSKETKKRNKYNDQILNAVAIRHNVSLDYVRKSLKGTSTGIVPDQLVKDYNKGVNELNAIITKTVKNFINK